MYLSKPSTASRQVLECVNGHRLRLGDEAGRPGSQRWLAPDGEELPGTGNTPERDHSQLPDATAPRHRCPQGFVRG
jgi:hypothetical protein